MSDPRAAFESWFAAAYGPDPSDGELLANLHEAARQESFKAGAWAAWQVTHAERAELLSLVEGVHNEERHDEMPRRAVGACVDWVRAHCSTRPD